jgi:hypothetical protein
MKHQEKYWRFPELDEFLKDFRHEMTQVSRPASEVFLDEADAMKLLKVSKRTLANWRSNNTLKYRKLGGKIYYILQDILDCLEQGEGSDAFIKPKF